MSKVILKNASWMMGERMVSMAINLLVTLWLARSLGPEIFGQLAYLLAAVALVLPVASLGVNDIVTRELVEAQRSTEHVIATSLGLRIAGAALGLVLLLLWLMLAQGLTLQERWALAIIALGSTAQALHVINFLFQAQLKSRNVSRMRSSVALVFGVAKCGVAWFSNDLVWLAAVFALEYVAYGFGYVAIYRRLRATKLTLHQFSSTYAWQLLRQSSWLILSGVAAAVYLKIDQVMLGHMTSAETLGHYALAARLSEAWYVIAVALASSYFAVLMREREANPQAFTQRVQRLLNAMVLLALAIAIVVTLLAEPLVPWLFGAAYESSAAILAVHIWAGVFVFMRAVASKWLLSHRYMKFSLITHGSGAVLNVLANLWLIPRYGAMGAAWATVLAYAVAGYFSFWLTAATRPMARQMTRALLLYGYWQVARSSTAGDV